jgi:hypothetical protein
MKKDFLPRPDGDFDTWEENFITELVAVAAAVGLTPQQVQDITDKINAHRSLYATATTKKNQAQAATNTARLGRKETEGDIRPLVRQIKASPGYTVNIGQTLDIIGPDEVIDWDLAKPTLKVSYVGEAIKIEFNKSGSDGIKLKSKRGNETEFTFLAIDTESPYIDTRPKLSASGSTPPIPSPGNPIPSAAAAGPENREYEAYYMLGDEQVGLVSATVKITIP